MPDSVPNVGTYTKGSKVCMFYVTLDKLSGPNRDVIYIIGLGDYKNIAGFPINGIASHAFSEIHIFCRWKEGRS